MDISPNPKHVEILFDDDSMPRHISSEPMRRRSRTLNGQSLLKHEDIHHCSSSDALDKKGIYHPESQEGNQILKRSGDLATALKPHPNLNYYLAAMHDNSKSTVVKLFQFGQLRELLSYQSELSTRISSLKFGMSLYTIYTS